jgi:hypothetical protein
MHENDAVLAFPDFTVHCELKHLSGELSKNELLIFNQKGIDHLLAEGRTLRRLPFYRVILSGGLVSPAARRFAVQWGILIVEPDRLSFLVLHNLCGRIVPPLRNVPLQTQDDLWGEVPRLVTPPARATLAGVSADSSERGVCPRRIPAELGDRPLPARPRRPLLGRPGRAQPKLARGPIRDRKRGVRARSLA